ncbi:MAG: ribosome biogenesis GTPase YlqF [Clostridia bacterium]|nr:ribosome biogenesis GTPase YlqF [Clostridia bacterium]
MNENKTNINWYPGHMAKAKREIKENLKLIDIIIEIIDARIPRSSRNPDFDEIVLSKPRIVALNKSDMSDKLVNDLWVKRLKEEGTPVTLINALTGNGIGETMRLTSKLMEDKLNMHAEKGRIGKPIRALVLGIPNSGKSSFINKVAGRQVAVVGNKPGVTKEGKWIKTNFGVELMDTPGILWPKFENEETALHLAYTGAIKYELLDNTELTLKLIEELKENYSEELKTRYKLEDIDGTPLSIYEKIGKNRGYLISGGEIDYERTANMIVDEFRKGIIGRISLERP